MPRTSTSPRLLIRSSAIHAAGCYTLDPIRNIAAGEELVYEYNLFDSDEDDADCTCGAPQCRGTMFSEEEVKRQKRKKARKRALKKWKK